MPELISDLFLATPTRSPARGIALAAVAALLPACQSFKPKPLDPAAHAAVWREQSPQSEAVRAYAKRLAETAGEGGGDFDPGDGLALHEGRVVALVYNPDLRIARLRAEVAAATAEHAGRWDDPELSLDVLKIQESVPDPWIIGSALSLTVPVSGRLAVEKARAEAEAGAELERVAEEEWRVQADLTDAWLEWSASRMGLAEAERMGGALDEIVSITGKLAGSGEMPETEAALFAIERENRRAELAHLRGEVAAAEQSLRGLMGLAPDAPVRLLPSLSGGRIGAGEGGELEATNPTLVRLRAEYAVAEKALQREVRKQFPDVVIGGSGESDEGQSRIGFVGAIPVPILNANEGGIASARAEREVARAAFEAEYERLSGQLAAQRAKRGAAIAQRERLETTLAPLVDQQLRDARRLLELGEGSSLVLLESLVRAHEAKRKLIEVRRDEALAANAIRRLIGHR